ncbi:MAG: prolyl oligopeptidase family serine peptidase [Anaerolineae bacterium]|nr:prolyl oligopeptidase family serine peptidase [Anaerolineae bacterium]
MLRFSALLLLMTALIIPAQAQERFDAPTYAHRGDYAVGTMELTIQDEDRPLNVTVWYPANATPGEEPLVSYPVTGLLRLPGHAYRDAEPLQEDAPYPLIVFSHGSGGGRALSLYYTQHLASQGFIVMAADHPGNDIAARMGDATDFAVSYAERPRDLVRQIDYAADVLNAEDGFFAGMIDMENVGVSGHSFGGWTVLSAAGGRIDFPSLREYCSAVEDENTCFMLDLEEETAAARGFDSVPDAPWEAISDDRIKAVVALAPWNGPLLELSQVTAPTLIIVGGGDTVTVPERDAYPIYEALQSPKALMTLQLGNHYMFVDECPELLVQLGFQYACTDPVWDMARAHDLTNQVATAFFRTYLKGDEEAAAALDPAAVDFPGVVYQSAP